ncbi:hypothetical protein [Selenomonas sputigena]|uniref:hypothetical protein n=1 Tax=Selenomonas sputigena TaxID=69823 RepID=UPI00222EB28F|nr:hypothetical protein [Selenomonas sputigena]UZD44265.1 hypothetical protein OL240_04975 [Selenomonas sputigena]
MARCRACGKEIRWIKTLAGKAMPVDPKPVLYWEIQGGSERIVTPEGKIVSCALKGKVKNVTGLGYIPHWATCSEQQSIKRSSREQVDTSQGSLF